MPSSKLPLRFSHQVLQCLRTRPISTGPRSFSTGRCLRDEDGKQKPQKADVSLKLSEGEPDDVLAQAIELIEKRGWKVSPNKEGLEKTFYFLGPTQANRFLIKINEQAKKIPHHPKWVLQWQPITIRWQTYRPKGFSQKDVDMIEFTETTAARLAERLKNRTGIDTPQDGDEVEKQLPLPVDKKGNAFDPSDEFYTKVLLDDSNRRQHVAKQKY